MSRAKSVLRRLRLTLYEFIMARQYEPCHWIVTATTWQDAIKFFKKKYPGKHVPFAAKGKPSKFKEGHINVKEHKDKD